MATCGSISAVLRDINLLILQHGVGLTDGCTHLLSAVARALVRGTLSYSRSVYLYDRRGSRPGPGQAAVVNSHSDTPVIH